MLEKFYDTELHNIYAAVNANITFVSLSELSECEVHSYGDLKNEQQPQIFSYSREGFQTG